MADIDLDHNGKLDEYEKKQYKVLSGRTFWITAFSIVLIATLAVLDKGTSSFPYITGLVGLYAGRSLGQDFSKNS